MRTGLLVIAWLLLALSPVAADEKKAAEEPPKKPAAKANPLPPEQAADKVLKAVTAKDDAALKALAEKDNPDPWLVADALIARNQHDVAEAFAEAGAGKDVEKLPAYIASRREKCDDTATRKAWGRANTAVGKRDIMGVAAALEGVEPQPGTVLDVLVGYGRASLLLRTGELESAASVARLATDAAVRLGWYRQAARIQIVQGSGRFARNDLNGSLDAYRIALEVQRQRGDRASIARTLHYLGNVHKRRGEVGHALDRFKQAGDIEKALGDREGVAGTLIDMAHLYGQGGRYVEALDHYQRGLRIALALGRQDWAANAVEGLGNVYSALGDHPKARAHYERALEARRGLGHKLGVASAMHNLGCVWLDLGDLKEALLHYEQALAIRNEIGQPRVIAETLTGLARLHLRMGNHEQAIACAERALKIYAELGERLRALDVLRTLGEATLAAGETEKAVALLERAVSEARRLRDSWLLPHLLSDLARARLDTAHPERALSAALAALSASEATLAGLAGEEGIEARASFSELMGIGMLAARKCGDLKTAFLFIETGRAGGLLESLAGRRELRAAVLPEALRRVEREARERVAAAQQALRRGRAGASLKNVRKLRNELSAANDDLLAAHARIQRAARQGASLMVPRPVTLAAARASLQPHQALVSYVLARAETLAFVLTAKKTAFVSLGTSEELREVIARYDLGNSATSAQEALTALRRVLVDPLSLPAAVKTVLVSPAGSIGTLPLGAIFDSPVAVVPSATTYLLLKDQATERSTGVLALGDPDYGGKSGLMRNGYRQLPATRLEAETVGTDVLLGAGASESGLSLALKRRPHWRAVHFACHASVDLKRPMLSALVLSADESSDGLLTCLEVYRMRLPADLAVLAGAGTALGKIYLAEGIVGLVPAFLYAGAPRVIGSVWNVDDLATRALMIRFYELWNPKEGHGIGAAAALKQAQAFIRDHAEHPEWKHPYYWAAWVLWGLPN